MQILPSGGAERPFVDAAGRDADQIRIVEIAAVGKHGALPEEREAAQSFTADVILHVDSRAAARADDLSQTVDYSVVASEVEAILAGPPATLIETLAERIAASVLAHPGVLAVDVRVHKPEAPLETPVADVVIAIRRTPDDVALPAPVIAVAEAEPVVEEPVAVEPAVEEPVVQEPVVEDTIYSAPVAEAPVVEDTVFSVPVEVVEPVVEEPVIEEPLAVADSISPLDLAPAEPVEVVLALGANQGAAKQTLRTVVAELDDIPGTSVKTVSPLVKTKSVGGPPGAPDYLNAVVIVETTLSPRALLAATTALEAAYGRVRTGQRDEPRTLDIDIVAFGDLVEEDAELAIPHPRAGHRAFVLVPWAHIRPAADLPGLGGGPVAALAQTAPDREGIRWLALDWLIDPVPAPAGSAPAAAPVAAPAAQVAPVKAAPVAVAPVPAAPIAPSPAAELSEQPQQPQQPSDPEPRTMTSTLAAASKGSALKPPPSWDDILKPNA